MSAETTCRDRRPVHLRPGCLALAFVGGAAGTAARAGLGLLFDSAGWFGGAHEPAAVLAANLLGSLILGFVLEALAVSGPDTGARRGLRLLVGTGFCGGFTTYSTLAVTTLGLFTSGSWPAGLAYGLGTVVAGLLIAWAGIRLARALPLKTGEAAAGERP